MTGERAQHLDSVLNPAEADLDELAELLGRARSELPNVSPAVRRGIGTQVEDLRKATEELEELRRSKEHGRISGALEHIKNDLQALLDSFALSPPVDQEAVDKLIAQCRAAVREINLLHIPHHMLEDHLSTLPVGGTLDFHKRFKPRTSRDQ